MSAQWECISIIALWHWTMPLETGHPGYPVNTRMHIWLRHDHDHAPSVCMNGFWASSSVPAVGDTIITAVPLHTCNTHRCMKPLWLTKCSTSYVKLICSMMSSGGRSKVPYHKSQRPRLIRNPQHVFLVWPKESDGHNHQQLDHNNKIMHKSSKYLRMKKSCAPPPRGLPLRYSTVSSNTRFNSWSYPFKIPSTAKENKDHQYTCLRRRLKSPNREITMHWDRTKFL